VAAERGRERERERERERKRVIVELSTLVEKSSPTIARTILKHVVTTAHGT